MITAINTSSTAVGSNDDSQDQHKKILTLWTQDFIACQPLAPFFHIATLGSEQHSGEHVIALEKEREIRLLARTLSATGKTVSVFVCHDPLELSIHTMGHNAAMMILQQKLSYAEWLNEIKEAPLSLEDAVAIATDILFFQPESVERTIELDTLGRRAKVSDYKWSKDYLAAIKAQLEKSLNLPSSEKKSAKERLRLDIQALLKETDVLDYEVTRADIQSRYRLNHKALEKIIHSISQLSQEAESVDLGLDELFDQPTNNVEYLIPGMLPLGEAALLIANPKAGKSLLAYDAAFAVATGEDTFLGERCLRGKVLIIQCDESTATAKGRLLKRGFRREDGPNVRFMPKFNITQLGALERSLESFRPKLVVIDSVRRICAGREISENSAEFADYIYQLKELCAKYNAALLLIHHSNKNADAIGVEKVRGSTAIAGAVWGVWELTQKPKTDPNNKKKLIIDPKDPTRLLSITARDVEGQRLLIELDPENNHWINRGVEGVNPEEVKKQKCHAGRVIELLKSVAPTGLEAGEINERLDIGRGVYSIVNRLLAQKMIGSRPSTRDRRRTVYFCSLEENPCIESLSGTASSVGNPPPPTETVSNVIEYAESIDISSVQRSITIDHNSIALDHSPPEPDGVKQASNLDIKSDAEYSITSSPVEGERGVESDVIHYVPEVAQAPRLQPIAKDEVVKTNPQLLLATTQTILGIIAIHTQPYFKWEDNVNAAVELLPLTENWSEVQEIISGLELDKAQQQEVERRLTQLGHSGKLHALSGRTQVAQSELAAGEKVAKAERLFRNGDRVRYQHWYGRFAGYARSGCLVEFDKSKSTTKLYGPAPTQLLAESELVLVKRFKALK